MQDLSQNAKKEQGRDRQTSRRTPVQKMMAVVALVSIFLARIPVGQFISLDAQEPTVEVVSFDSGNPILSSGEWIDVGTDGKVKVSSDTTKIITYGKDGYNEHEVGEDFDWSDVTTKTTKIESGKGGSVNDFFKNVNALVKEKHEERENPTPQH